MSHQKARRIDLYPDEFWSGVAGKLRADEIAFYWMVCLRIYSEGGPVDNDPAYFARACCTRKDHAERVIASLIAKGKLVEVGAKLHQARAELELEKVAKRISDAHENGVKGGRPKKKTQQNQGASKPAGFSDEKLTTNHQPPTTNHSDSSNEESGAGAPTLTLEVQEQGGNRKPQRRGTRMEPDAVLPEAWALWAKAQGHPDPAAEWERFRDYWAGVAGKAGVKLDWEATWRNRVRSVIQDGRCAVGARAAPAAGDSQAPLDVSLEPHRELLYGQFPQAALKSWFPGVRLVDEGGATVLAAPTAFVARYLRENYEAKLKFVFGAGVIIEHVPISQAGGAP